MTIIAHAPVRPEHRLDEADTQSLTLHPRWCSQDACEQPDGEAFHTLTVVEIDAADADVLNCPTSLDLWVEQIDDGPVSLQIVTTPLGSSTRRTSLTPAQAVNLGTWLVQLGESVGA